MKSVTRLKLTSQASWGLAPAPAVKVVKVAFLTFGGGGWMVGWKEGKVGEGKEKGKEEGRGRRGGEEEGRRGRGEEGKGEGRG
jgi:hypothetical protein